MSTEKKRGAISAEEEKFLRKNYKDMTPGEIADTLNRNEETVRAWFKSVIGVSPDDPYLADDTAEIKQIKRALTRSPEWAMLRDELTEDEMKYFQHKYCRLVAQFDKEGIFATEETQIFLLIKYEILMRRTLVEQKETSETIRRLEKMLKDTYDQYPDASLMDQPTKVFCTTMENQISALRIGKQAKTREHNDLAEKHGKIMRDMKSTRDQRISRIENASGSVLELFKKLSDDEVQRQKGRHMELVAKAVEKQRRDLMQQHKFVDGSIDKPLLIPEDVG